MTEIRQPGEKKVPLQAISATQLLLLLLLNPIECHVVLAFLQRSQHLITPRTISRPSGHNID